MTETELLPCPFCGGDAETDSRRHYRAIVGGKPGTGVAVYCLKCDADMMLCREDFPGADPSDLLNILIENWNTRTPPPTPAVARTDGNRPLPLDRDTLGRMVREAWVRWAKDQPSPKPSWLVPYDDLSEADKEADRQIGETIARWTIIHDAAQADTPAVAKAVEALEPFALLAEAYGDWSTDSRQAYIAVGTLRRAAAALAALRGEG